MKIIFEMANNHMGNVAHGVSIIEAFATEVSSYVDEHEFVFKFQFRDLDTFIHPDFKGSELKFVKRFEETRLTDDEWSILFQACRKNGFAVMVTPFDEVSVAKCVDFGVDQLKIASCSLGDWPLFEAIAEHWEAEITMSTAGATLQAIDNAVDFFSNRQFPLTVMHCVGLYPTPIQRYELGQIEFLRSRYPSVRVGYSTHEDPDDSIAGAMAVALGAEVFEKHVALERSGYLSNEYSASPEQVSAWLSNLIYAKTVLGGGSSGRHRIEEDEALSLAGLKRGVFAKGSIEAGTALDENSVFFAIPAQANGLVANNWSKYSDYKSTAKIGNGEPLIRDKNVSCASSRTAIEEIHNRMVDLIGEAALVLPKDAVLEISHHYGLDRFYEYGLGLITVVNHEYCKKILLCLPGQSHPAQYHKKKAETFCVVFGELDLKLDGVSHTLNVGDVKTVTPGVVHEFSSQTGCVIEEISTTHFGSDSFYIDESINRNENRKTSIKVRV